MSPTTFARQFSMAELVEQTGVAAATVRYYLSVGLLPPPAKLAANRFLYDERHVELIRIIRLLRERRALSLDAIGRALPELVPDLLDRETGEVFRPEMWRQLLSKPERTSSGPTAKERLLEAGLELFGRRGYAEVAVDDVCRAAGVAKGSFYRHFPSKEELFFASATLAADRVVSSFLAEVGEEKVVRSRAVALLAIAIGEHLALFLDLSSLAAQRRPGHGRVMRTVLENLRSRIKPHLDLMAGERSRDVFGAALVDAVFRAIGDPVATPVLSALLVDDTEP